MKKIVSNNVEETMMLGEKLGKYLSKGDIVALSGIFGVGKTYFTKGIAKGLGVKKTDKVNSPSFVLCNVYKGKKINLYHFDAYRLDNPKELFGLGLNEFSDDGVCVLEWAEKLFELESEQNIISIKFKTEGDNKRELSFSDKRLNNFYEEVKNGKGKNRLIKKAN